MTDWKEEERIARLKKTLRAKLTLLGKKVRVKGSRSEGTIVMSSFANEKGPEYFIQYKNGVLEQACCLDFRLQDASGEWSIVPDGVQMFPQLTLDELEITGLDDHETILEKI